jgi:pimeloyl-ACP methyl ester carboxylesterase
VNPTRRPWWRQALRGAGVVGGVAGAAYATERAIVAGVRRKPDPDAGRELAPPFDEARRIPSHDDGSIYTISRGVGPTILFSHGVTLNVRLWFKQFEELPERGLRVVAFDHRGHGESECGTSGHSVENLGADLKAVIEGLDLRDVTVVGQSMGGVAAQSLAISHAKFAAKRVRGLVLMSTLAKTHLSGSRRLRCAMERVAEGRLDASTLMTQPNFGFLLARIGFGRDPEPSHVELTRQMIASCKRDQSSPAIKALLGLDMTEDLPNITVPTLVMSGSADLIAPPSESRRIAELVPGARLEVFKGAGHMLMFERTEEVNDLITEFVLDPGVGGASRRWWPRRRPRRRGPGERHRRAAVRTRVATVS